jgi:hypothetical protein
MYTAVVLTDDSHSKLVATFGHLWQDQPGWETLAHHLTIHMGKATDEEQLMLGEFATLVIDAVAGDDKVMAVRVMQVFTTRVQVESKNPTPHITLAVNREAGGKPFFSNKLTDWEQVDHIRLRGRIEEVG